MTRHSEVSVTNDTRKPYQPAPVVLPGRTMLHVAERVRLLRQGDHREIIALEAALKKGKGLRPWRLATENPDLFHPARLMREEEERRCEKVFQTAGLNLVVESNKGFINVAQAPVANLDTKGSITRVTNTTGDGDVGESACKREAGSNPSATSNHDPEGNSTRLASGVNLTGGDDTQEEQSAASIATTRTLASPDIEKNAAASQSGVHQSGGINRGLHGKELDQENAGRNSTSATVTTATCVDPVLPGFDIESDVRKRVLDFVGADVLDRLQAFFSEANGRLRKRAFIQALCAACDEDQQKLNGGAVVAAGGSICPRRITPEDVSSRISSATGNSTPNAEELCEITARSSGFAGRLGSHGFGTVVNGSTSAGNFCPAASTRKIVGFDLKPPLSVAAPAPISDLPRQSPRQGESPAEDEHDGSSGGLKCLPPHAASPKRLVTLFSRLFDFVSLQNADWATWDELSNFLLCDGETPAGGGSQGGIRPYLPAACSRVPKILGLESTIVFKLSRMGQEMDMVALLIRHSSSFLLAVLQDLQATSTSVRVKGHTGQVLAVTFVPPYKLLVTSGEKDRMLRCWDIQVTPELDAIANKRQAKASEPQIMLRWLELSGESKPRREGSAETFSDRLVSGSAGGAVNVWKLSTKELALLHSLTGHTGAVTSVCIIPRPEVVVTGALDADMRVWESGSLKCKRVMKGHTRGVVTIEYSPSQRIIVSAGFDHDILVWSPVAGQVICRLAGHGCSLVAARVTSLSSDVISMSMDGIIKVWDSANFKCVQTINANDNQVKGTPSAAGRRNYGGKGVRLRSGGAGNGGVGGERGGGQTSRGESGGGGRMMRWGKSQQSDSAGSTEKNKAAAAAPTDLLLFEGEMNRLLVCRGPEVAFYENGEAGEKDVTDSNQTIDVMYHAQTGTFATVAPTGVKLWDARTGKLARTYGVPPPPTKLANDGWKSRKAAHVPVTRQRGGKHFRTSRGFHRSRPDAEGGGNGCLGQADEITSACVDSSGRQLVMGFNTGRVACVRYLTGTLVGRLDSHRGEVTNVMAVWNRDLGCLILSVWDVTACLQKLAVDASEPRRTMAVLDPQLETIRMERFRQVVEASLAKGGLVKRINVGSKVLRVKNVFLTTLDNFRAEKKRAMAAKAVGWSGATLGEMGGGDGAIANDFSDGVSDNDASQPISVGITTAASSTEAVVAGAPSPSWCPAVNVQGEGRPSEDGDSHNTKSIGDMKNANVVGGYRPSLAPSTPQQEKNDDVVANSRRQEGGNECTDQSRVNARSSGVSAGGKEEELRPAVSTARAAVQDKGGMVATSEPLSPDTTNNDAGRWSAHAPPIQLPRSTSSSSFHKLFARRFKRGNSSDNSLREEGQKQEGNACGSAATPYHFVSKDKHATNWGSDSPKDDVDADDDSCVENGGARRGRGERENRRRRKNTGGDARHANEGGQAGEGGSKTKSNCGSHITCVAVSCAQQLVATGSLNGNLVVWDVRKGPSTCGLGLLKAHNGYQATTNAIFRASVRVKHQEYTVLYQVNSICFLEPRAALATCNLEGGIAVWRMGPAPDPRREFDEYEMNFSCESLTNPSAGEESQRKAEKRARLMGKGRVSHREEGESMAPCSTWRCVALFFNNVAAAPAQFSDDNTRKTAGRSTVEGAPAADESMREGSPELLPAVPSAVNSLAWSTTAERLYTGDTVGFVRVWGIKWALGSTGTGLDEEKPELKANPLYDDAGNAIYDNPFDDRDHGMDAGELDKTATSTSIPASNANTATTGESGRGVVQTTSDHDRTVHDSVTTDDISSVAEESLMDGTVTPPAENIRHTKAGTKDRKENGSTGEGSGDIDGSTAHSGNPAAGSDGGKWESTAASPWEPDSIDGEHCGDRFRRGVGLRFIRRLGEWRPGREGRQEVIKVKVFEDEGAVYRGVLVGRSRRDGRQLTKSGTILVATITSDKLVRFWTSGGIALGSLDQEHVASPQRDIAARPLESWRIRVASVSEGEDYVMKDWTSSPSPSDARNSPTAGTPAAAAAADADTNKGVTDNGEDLHGKWKARKSGGDSSPTSDGDCGKNTDLPQEGRRSQR